MNAAADAEFEVARSNAKGDRRRTVTMFRHAAFLYWEATKELPESVANRVVRGVLLAKALSTYRQVQHLSPDPQNEEDSRRIIREYCQALREAYGEAADDLDEYRRAQAHLATLTPESPERPMDGRSNGVEDIRGSDAPRTIHPPSTAPATETARLHDRAELRLRIGLGLSASLAGATGIAALVTGLALVRDPFHGARYQDIRDAAAAADNAGTFVFQGGGDICVAGYEQDIQGLIESCKAYEATKWGSIAMGLTAGASLVAAATLGALLARSRRIERTAHRQSVGIGMAPGGVELRFGMAF